MNVLKSPKTAEISRKALLSYFEILGLLASTLTADDEYSRSNMENLPLPNQMQLSEKSKTSCCNRFLFLEFTLNFEHFEKK